MPIVFPFDPEWGVGLRERQEYLTDILAGYDGSEQRVKVRQSPRLRISFSVLVGDSREYSSLLALLYGGSAINEFAVPLWQDAMPLTEDAAAAGTSIDVDTPYRRFVAGGSALVWRDFSTWELVTIDTVAGDSIALTAGLVNDWAADGRTFVVPLRNGLLDIPTPQLHGPRITSMDVSFLCESVPASTATVDLLELEPSRPGEIAVAHGRALGQLDSKSGLISTVAHSTTPALSWDPFVWIMDGRAEAAQLLEFLDARQGALVPFFVPTWQRDLQLAEAAAADAVEIRIERCGYTDFLFPIEGRKRLAFLFADGTKIYRLVTAAVVDGDTEVLTIDAPIGAAIPATTMVAFQRYARLATDQPEILWHTREVAESSLPIMETREPPPVIVPATRYRPTAHTFYDGSHGEVQNIADAYDNNDATFTRILIEGGIGLSSFDMAHYHDFEEPESLVGLVSVTFHVVARWLLRSQGPPNIYVELFDGVDNFDTHHPGVGGLIENPDPSADIDWTDFTLTIDAATYLAMDNATIRAFEKYTVGSLPGPYPNFPALDIREIWKECAFA